MKNSSSKIPFYSGCWCIYEKIKVAKIYKIPKAQYSLWYLINKWNLCVGKFHFTRIICINILSPLITIACKKNSLPTTKSKSVAVGQRCPTRSSGTRTWLTNIASGCVRFYRWSWIATWCVSSHRTRRTPVSVIITRADRPSLSTVQIKSTKSPVLGQEASHFINRGIWTINQRENSVARPPVMSHRSLQ